MGTRPVRPAHSAAEVLARLDDRLPDGPTDPVAVIDALVEAVDGGLTATGSPAFFGYVIGGTLPAALAADVLAVVWDQNAALASLSPAASAVESVAGRWVTQLLGLPSHVSVGFTTGTQMAHVTALAAARHRVLADAGWDVEADGLLGAPPVRVLAGADRHATVDAALRLLGLGRRAVVPVATDGLGRMRPDALRAALAGGAPPSHTHPGHAAGPGRAAAARPTIVITQVGEVNTGAADPLAEICALAHEHGGWVHVDGAFGLWAAVSGSPARRALVAGAAQADSWATDGHKWLNVPYDCGIALVADPAAHRGAMAAPAVYFPPDGAGQLDPVDWTPEFSRRARAFAVYAALRSLGRAGLRELVDRCCDLADHAAHRLAAVPGLSVLNATDGPAAPGGLVPLNQVLLRVDGPARRPGCARADIPSRGYPDPAVAGDRLTREVTAAVTAGGEAYLTGTTWRGQAAMRLSVSNWATTLADVDRAVDVIAAAVAARRAGGAGDAR
ncbi:putative amino acid decarboxylase, Pyridoxal-dependent protein [Frankia canadensis]|uniref:Putative amino acid decarboxylase, Pyridoxal-dependent protein n=1 Tax=Frankia canadensis TaxID=1836972 RepID=A0A2I2KK08_9ACTN|nr:pyridoxal-dependent decarboxylase [Frankia canadensis]SNQ45995.1 putative amino acid decarboxylase, Pyridoxal-dependent protein [Frankia canadensis]SOU53285.1 putative amino acid decarboxylase, Pyridoxal-dependent protein [Frankia canadensis]